MADKYTTLPPTPAMAQAGLTFGGLVDYARRAIDLLRSTGDAFVDVLESGFKLWTAVAGRDLGGVLAAFAQGRADVNQIIDAIRAEFGV